MVSEGESTMQTVQGCRDAMRQGVYGGHSREELRHYSVLRDALPSS
jgi:hypothetical protein